MLIKVVDCPDSLSSSNCSSLLVSVKFVVELTILIFVNCHVLPVYGVGFPLGRVSDCWHLEGEEEGLSSGVIGIALALLNIIIRVRVHLEDKVVTLEFSVKSSDNHDFVRGNLAHSCSLSG